MAESPFIKMTLQAQGANVDNWGVILNESALECLEDAIAGTGTVDVTSGNVTLTDTEGGPSAPGPAPAPHSRFMILNVIGAPGAVREVIVPDRSKVYLISNTTSPGFGVTVKTAAGTGPTIDAGEGQWVFCDGTNVLAASAATATSAANATLATNSTQLAGIAGTDYALKTAAQSYSGGQVTTRQTVTLDDTMGGAPYFLNIDCAQSNAFFLAADQDFTMNAPTNATDGQQFTLVVEQQTGFPHTITFAASTFITPGGTLPTLSTGLNDVDYLAFEYVTGLTVGARWIVTQLKGNA